MFMRTFTCLGCSACRPVWAVPASLIAPRPWGGALPPLRPRTCPCSLRQIRCDLLASLDQRCDRLGRLFEHGTFSAVQLNLDDALDALRADHGGHTHIKGLDPLLPVEIGPAKKNALLFLLKSPPPGDSRQPRP